MTILYLQRKLQTNYHSLYRINTNHARRAISKNKRISLWANLFAIITQTHKLHHCRSQTSQIVLFYFGWFSWIIIFWLAQNVKQSSPKPDCRFCDSRCCYSSCYRLESILIKHSCFESQMHKQIQFSFTDTWQKNTTF